jgi:hypothetical protein
VVNQNSLNITNKITKQIEQTKYQCVTNAYLNYKVYFKATSSKTNSTNNSKASAQNVTMKHGQKTLETFMKTSVSQGPKQIVRSHTPPTLPDRQDDQTHSHKNND